MIPPEKCDLIVFLLIYGILQNAFAAVVILENEYVEDLTFEFLIPPIRLPVATRILR
jgi:hypothetical protein